MRYIPNHAIQDVYTRLYAFYAVLLFACPFSESFHIPTLGETIIPCPSRAYQSPFIAFRDSSTPTNVAAYISASSAPFFIGSMTYISRESPSHGWSESFPESSNSIRGDQFPSTIEETRVCALRSRLKSGFDGLSRISAHLPRSWTIGLTYIRRNGDGPHCYSGRTTC
jgi:hypothetical protein